jgi:hypothetical protein
MSADRERARPQDDGREPTPRCPDTLDMFEDGDGEARQAGAPPARPRAA